MGSSDIDDALRRFANHKAEHDRAVIVHDWLIRKAKAGQNVPEELILIAAEEVIKAKERYQGNALFR